MAEVRKIENVAVGAGSKPRRDLSRFGTDAHTVCMISSAWFAAAVATESCPQSVRPARGLSVLITESGAHAIVSISKDVPSWLTKCCTEQHTNSIDGAACLEAGSQNIHRIVEILVRQCVRDPAHCHWIGSCSYELRCGEL